MFAIVLIIASICQVIPATAEEDKISKKLLSHIFKADSSTNNGSPVKAKNGMPITPPLSWSTDAKLFFLTVQKLGLFQLKNVHLIKVNKSMVKALESHNRSITVRSADQTTRKRNFHDFCLEKVVKTFYLAHASEQLAYTIDEIECYGKCYSTKLGIKLGECILRKSSMIVYVQNSQGAYKAQTVETGCTCECLHYAQFQ